jgi:hypothetical protein
VGGPTFATDWGQLRKTLQQVHTNNVSAVTITNMLDPKLSLFEGKSVHRIETRNMFKDVELFATSFLRSLQKKQRPKKR